MEHLEKGVCIHLELPTQVFQDSTFCSRMPFQASDKALYFAFQGYIFVQLGLNEADTNKSSSILIYHYTRQRIYTPTGRLMSLEMK
jgi:hypothetical protein